MQPSLVVAVRFSTDTAMRYSNAKDVFIATSEKAVVIKSGINIARYKTELRRHKSDPAKEP